MKRPAASKLFLVCLSIILVSCDSQNTPIPTFETQSPIGSSTPSPFQSETPEFTSTVFLTTTPEPTVTFTLPPTLDSPMRDSEMRKLMQNSDDCKPPCFLGIMPGQTTLDELEKFFFHYGLFPSDYQGSVYAIGHYVKKEIPPNTKFFVKNGVVTSIGMDIDQSNEFEWSIYSPAAVLNRVGTPSRVTFGLSTIHEPNPTPSKGWYMMTFFYDDVDFIIQYIDAEIKLGELITVCPSKDIFDGARLWLGNFEEDPSIPSPDTPLEDATSFTVESFRDFLLLGPGACFDLNASAIPIY